VTTTPPDRPGERRSRAAAAPTPSDELTESPTATEGGSSRGAAHVGAGILLSRLAGLVREVVTAGALGLTGSADAFRAALRIPNLMQNLLGEGVLSASFIPVYSRLADTDEEEAGQTAGAVAGLLVAATSVLVVIGMVAARPLTILLTPGFTGEKLDLTVSLVRIMFPGVGLLVLSAWCLAILNSHRRFFLSYVAPVLWNAAQVIVLAVVAIGGATPRSLANALAAGVVLGGVLQLGLQYPSVRSLVPHLRFSLDRNRRAVRDSLSRVGPVIFGRGVLQISGYVNLLLASLLASGALAADTTAQFLYLLPISLFGMSIAAAELPELSRLGPQSPQAARSRLEHGLGRVAYFVAPTAVLYVALGELLVSALFERGRFGPSDSRLVWLSLSAYALGLLATTASRLLQNTLYALDDPRTPARIALVRVVVGTVVALSLMFWFDQLVLVGTSIRSAAGMEDADALRHLGVVGIAIGSATAAWVEFLLLRAALAWRIGRPTLGGGRLPVVLTAALLAAAAGRVVALVLGDPPAMVAAVPVFATAGAVYLAATTFAGLGLRAQLAGRPAPSGARSR